MRSTILTMMFCLSSLLSSAQPSCDSVKKENTYLRKALDLNKPLKEAQNGDLTFSIVKVTGDSKEQAVTIEVLIKNAGKNLESFGSEVKSISDPNGNVYKLYAAYVGQEKVYSSMHEKLYRDAPLKCKYIFRGIEPETKMIKIFPFPVKYHIPGTNSFDFVEESIEFRDFTITWK
jgi:hypothetical protein